MNAWEKHPGKEFLFTDPIPVGQVMVEFPKHKCSLSLEHNDHRIYHESIETYVKCRPFFDWISPESKRLSIETDELWTLQWYPENPVGFNAIGGHSLDAVLGACLAVGE